MFSTKQLVRSVTDIPSSFIYERYIQLPEKLTGQDIKILSCFKKESNPSMAIYWDREKNTYKFKCFTSGNSGDGVELVKKLHNINYKDACIKIIEDYNDYVLHNNGSSDIGEFRVRGKYKIKNYVVRQWNTDDKNFWSPYGIGSKLLEQYYVRPFSEYSMQKEEDGIVNSMTIYGSFIYGYFKKDGTLYKIYQPKNREKKFIKVADYIQGSEQLEGHDTLLWISSLKDIMAVKSLKLPVDLEASSTEKSMFTKEHFEKRKKEYKYIFYIPDTDETGIDSAKKYQEKFGIIPILIPLSKDISDSIKDNNKEAVKIRLIPSLDRAREIIDKLHPVKETVNTTGTLKLFE